MKRDITIYLLLSWLTIGSFSLFSCSGSDDDDDNPDAVTLKVFSPQIAVPGETIYFTGQNLDQVTSIIFPGNIEVTDITILNSFEIRALIPATISQSGYITLKTAHEEITSHLEIRPAEPVITICTPSYVVNGEYVYIRGNDLLSVTRVIFQDNVIVEALDFPKKTNEEIRIKVPNNAKDGTYPLEVVTSNNIRLTTNSITVEIIEEEEALVDPITSETKMIMDFESEGEDKGWHGPSWDNWNGSYDTNQAVEDGYITLVSRPGYWIIGCNHSGELGGFPSVNPAAYLLKVDIKTTTPIKITGEYEFAFVIGEVQVKSQLIVSGSGEFIETVDYDWQTLRMEISDILPNPTPNSGNFGIVLSHSPDDMDFAGLCFDNLRFDPK